MPNLTVSIDAALLKAAKVHAATQGTSISKIVREHLAEVTGLRPRPERSEDPLVRYARDEIGRKEAMEALDVGYGTLLDLMAERGLPLPELPPQETDAMALTFEQTLDAAGR